LAWGIAAVAALAAAQAPLHAQDAQPATNESGSIGPRELDNFTINGTVTQPAPQRQTPAPAPTPAPAAPRPSPESPTTAEPSPERAVRSVPSRPDRPAQIGESIAQRAPAGDSQPLRQTAPSSSVTAVLPGLDSTGEASATATEDVVVPDVPSNGELLLWPWLLAAIAAAAGLGFYFYRARLQPAFAGGADEDVHEEPRAPALPRNVAPRAVAPRHDPTPKTPPAPAPAPVTDEPLKGFVSTRLRPWIEIGFHASRCTIENDKVTIEFEIEITNTGNAPARGVLVEARLVNAGPSQDSEIGQFFSNPVGQGERIESIAPLRNVRIRSGLVMPLEQVQIYEIAGRKVFVPLIAFNILYSWARGSGQTSASYLVGRDTKGDKLAPFRLDLGPRLFRSLGQTPLPIAVRQ
jgi:hypothetical protein